MFLVFGDWNAKEASGRHKSSTKRSDIVIIAKSKSLVVREKMTRIFWLMDGSTSLSATVGWSGDDRRYKYCEPLEPATMTECRHRYLARWSRTDQYHTS
mmetsp:Transcript_4337/g.9768  ORF Transcript_4337/g.9768 Transcript_4337/m.9768 type:complete len:99 (-) Transcript_4337:808-1104(-)